MPLTKNDGQFLPVLLVKVCVLSSICWVDTVEAASPTFLVPSPDGSTGSRSVSEDAIPSVSILTVEGQDTDGDSLTFSIVTQSPNNPPFELGSLDGLLKVPNGLDAEKEQAFVFVFGVNDGSQTVNSIAFAVNITDKNDVTPELNMTSYSAAVLESVSDDDEILKVTAKDGDVSAPNNEFTFSLSGEGNDHFAINDTGYITVASSSVLDYSNKSSYSLTITVTDKGSNEQLSSTASLTVTVETDPKFTAPPNTNTEKTINETSGPDTSIFTCVAVDEDKSPANITYTVVEPSSGSTLFVMDGAILKTSSNVTNTTFDLEATGALQNYTVEIRATDGKYNATTRLTVVIEDVNDNAPTFTQPNYTLSIPEEQSAGVEVLKVTATDADVSAPNNEFTFSLDNDHFEIDDAGSINVSSTSQLNYTNTPSYNITLTVTDNATTNQLSSTATLSVTLETAPKFTAPPDTNTEEKINEDSGPDTSIFTCVAVDEDKSPDNITYTVVDVEPPSGSTLFVMDGAILKTSSSVTTSSFDLEADGAIETYRVEISVTDGKYNTSTRLNVTIQDINDETPTFTESSYALNVSETQAPGVVLLKVAATDRDFSAPNNMFTFNLSGEGNEDFKVNGTGYITVSSGLDYTNQPFYNLSIIVEDNAIENKLSSSVPLAVTVETAPGFTAPAADMRTVEVINEATGPDISIFTCAAVDEDESPDNITYTVVGVEPSTGFTLFVMDGAILKTNSSVTNTTFDLEANGAIHNYTIQIMASDGKYNATTTLSVRITDGTPVFTETHYTITISELQTPGEEILQVTAIDGDQITTNDDFTYSLTGDGSGHFSINDTGSISVSSPSQLDYTNKPSYSLTIIVRETTTGNQLSSSASLIVTLETGPKFTTPPSTLTTVVALDEDTGTNSSVFLCNMTDEDKGRTGRRFTLLVLNEPKFTAPENTTTETDLKEDSGPGTAIFTCAAIDEDESPDNITYTVVDVEPPLGSSLFVMDGAILKTSSNVTNTTFDLEAPGAIQNYRVEISVTDGKYNTSTRLNVTIQDINDETPTFTESSYALNVSETQAPGVVLLKVAATDRDFSAPNNMFTFNLSGEDNEHFKVNGTGYITVSSGLNYTNQPFYNLSIIVEDNAIENKLSSSVPLAVTVETAPKFPAPTNVTLDENKVAGYSVFTFDATDEDNSPSTLTYNVTSVVPSSGNTLFIMNGANLTTAPTVNSSTFDLEVTGPITNYSVEISVTDGKYNTSTRLNVTIQDINDETPTFTESSYALNVSETQDPGVVLLKVPATDRDFSAPNNMFTFNLSGEDNEHFKVNGTGYITVSSGLNYTNQPFYNLSIIVEDNAIENKLSSSVPLAVTVETAPKFPAPTNVTLDENKVAGYSVFTFDATDEDNSPSTLTYNVTSVVPSSGNTLFIMNGANLTTAPTVNSSTFDLEVTGPITNYSVEISVTDGKYNTSTRLNVTIQDINDETPTFTESSYALNVSETQDPGVVLLKVPATDRDFSAPNNMFTFNLSGEDNEHFKVNGTGYITVSSGLNYTNQPFYNLSIIVEDNAIENKLSSSVPLAVTVETAPKFPAPTNVTLDENKVAGYSVFTFDATDEDNSPSTLTYNVTSVVPSSGNTLFIMNGANLTTAPTVNSSTFDLEVTGPITNYSVEISVTDGKYNTSTRLNVTIQDINDETPTFTESSYVLNVSETQDPGVVLLKVAATDRDFSAPNNMFTFNLSGEDNEHFKVNSTGYITVSSGLNYTNQPFYNLSIIVEDNAIENKLSSSVPLAVTVETAPKFPAPTNVTLDENKVAGYSVFTFDATDEDNSPSTLTYNVLSVVPSGNTLFIMNGAILTAGPTVDNSTFDLEVTVPITNYSVEISVTDGKYNTSTRLNVTIQDINDETPTFTESSYALNVSETQAPGVVLLKVAATDRDFSAPNNMFTFNLSGEGNEDFKVNGTGYITVSSGLDYTNQPFYNLSIIVEDNAIENKLSSSVPLAVTVETAPGFTAPAADMRTVEVINEATGPDISIFTCAAVDEDESPDNITYTVVGVEPSTGFTLFVMDGAILKTNSSVTNTTFDLEANGAIHNYTIQIMASDGKYNATTTLSVRITDGTPVFTETHYTITISELQTPGEEILQVTAIDGDQITTNDDFTYSLTGDGSGHFSINDTGSISVSSSSQLNYTNKPSYSLTVTVTETTTGNNLSSSASLIVTLETGPKFTTPPSTLTTVVALDEDTGTNSSVFLCNVTDEDNGRTGRRFTLLVLNEPKFTVPENTTTETDLKEDSGPGTAIFTCTAMDGDESPDNITYTVVDVEPSPGPTLFVMDGAILKTSSVVTNTTFDREAPGAIQNYSVEIRATDGKYNATTRLTVRIEDVNDNAPTFNKTSYTLSIPEEQSAGVEVLKVTATDADVSAPNNEFTFSLDNGHFAIDGAGSIRVVSPSQLNYTNTPSYNITLTATDNATTNQLSSTATLSVTLETAPKFQANTTTEVALDEDKEAGFSVFTFGATDEDNTPSTLTYNVTSVVPSSGNTSFIMNGANLTTGPTVDNSTFDLEVTEPITNYSVEISVTDGKYNSSTRLTVKIQDINDKTPTFNESSYALNVSETQTAGVVLLKVAATDRDFSAPNNMFTFNLSGEGNQHFKVNGTGYITVSSGLNYTNQPFYNLSIIVEDNAIENKLSSSVPLAVTVETAPKFTAPPNTNTEKKINETSGPDTSIFTCIAVDEDESPDNITYTVVDVEPSSGPTLFVMDAPKFTNTSTNATLHENKGPDVQILTCTVVDEDNGDPNTLNFKVDSVEPAGGFTLFRMDGVALKTNSTVTTDSFDLEVASGQPVFSYLVEISVSDGKYSDVTQINVTVADVNDNAPVVVGPITKTINETHSIDQEIVTVTATDDDVTDEYNTLTYSLTAFDGTQDYSTFAIDPSTGVVTLKKELNKTPYTFTVKARDVDHKEGSTTVNITVLDTVDECSSSPCENEGTCVSNINHYNCNCLVGWSGQVCNTNIDDCDPNPCVNNGECTDGVASYTCNCSRGLTGTNCTQACSSNQYGRNCAETCQCNETRLAANTANQKCDIKTGACKCNTHWSGDDCGTDVDECAQDTTLCTPRPNSVCENTEGSYACVCKQGFTSKAAQTCVPVDENKTVSTNAGEKVVRAMLTQNFSNCDVTSQSVYRSRKLEVQTAEQSRFASANAIKAFGISCGSISYELAIILNDTDAAKTRLAYDLYEISNGKTLVLDNQVTVTTSLTVNGKSIPINSMEDVSVQICDIFTSYNPCGTSYVCKVTDGNPYCKKKDSGNISLTLGLSLGLSSGLIVIVCTVLIVYFCRKISKTKAMRMKRSQKSTRYEPAPRRHEIPPRIYTPVYDEPKRNPASTYDSFKLNPKYWQLPYAPSLTYNYRAPIQSWTTRSVPGSFASYGNYDVFYTPSGEPRNTFDNYRRSRRY